MGNYHDNAALRRTDRPGLGPRSGVRLRTRRDAWMSAPTTDEPQPCSHCGLGDARRLPPKTGPAYCRGCVDARPLDELDWMYIDIGGEG